MNTKIITLSLFTILTITGCSNDENNYKETTVKTGTIVDGYIKGSVVCLDLNKNNQCDSDEPRTLTDEKGNYILKINKIEKSLLDTAQIIAIGGIDTFTNKPFDSILKSNYISNNNIHLNSITTLIAETTENIDYSMNSEIIAKKLNIKVTDINNDILKIEDKSAFKSALKIQKALEMLKSNNNVDIESVRKSISNNIINTNMNLSESIDKSLSSEFLIEKERAKSIVETIGKNKSNLLSDAKNLQLKIERIKTDYINEVIIEGTISLYQENIEYLQTLTNINVNNLLKRINYRINLDDVLFEDDREFLEKINNMVISINPTIEEVRLELLNVGAATVNSNLILKLMAISMIKDINE